METKQPLDCRTLISTRLLKRCTQQVFEVLTFDRAEFSTDLAWISEESSNITIAICIYLNMRAKLIKKKGLKVENPDHRLNTLLYVRQGRNQGQNFGQISPR